MKFSPEEIVFAVYQKLGNFFTGSHRTVPLYVCLSVVFIVLFPLSIYNTWVIPEALLYTVFSSVVQALLALVAILGAVAIYRLSKIGQTSSEHYFVPEYAQKFTVYTFFIVMLSLLFLMFTPIISALYLGMPLLYLIFFLTGHALFMVAKGTPGFLYDSMTSR